MIAYRARPLRRIMHLSAALGLAVTTAACGSDTTFWSPAASPKANEVELVHLDHDVAFGASSVQMGAPALDELEAFLSRHGVGYGDRIYVVGAARGVNPVATRRAESVALHLRRQGIDTMVLPSAEWAGSRDDNSVRVLVHRFVVRAPNCPDWRKPPVDYGNTTASNFGCADATNLGLMVANPRDLVIGQPEGMADGTREAAAVKRYRDGKVKEFNGDGIVGDDGSGSGK